MTSHLWTVVEAAEFAMRARALLGEAERGHLIDYFAANPTAGDLMPGSGGARKVRWARPGGGKRGGFRVISYYGGPTIPVFLLALFAKNERVDLSARERNELRQVLQDLARQYRKGAQRYVQGRSKHPPRR